MEKIYKKVGNRYVEAGYNSPDLVDGIWLVQSKEHSKSMTNMVFRVGDLKNPRDVITQGALMSIQDDISSYVVKLTKEDTQEFKDLKNQYKGWVHGPLGVYNISIGDFVSVILNRIAENLERTEKTEWGRLMLDFRSSYNTNKGLANSPEGALWDFIEWLNKNGYELKQNKR
jgi:hypothetical protein